MPDFTMRTEPTYSGETEEQYRARISNIDALKLASEKRIWERKKLAEINKAKVELTNVLERMKNETITIEAPEGHVIDKENSKDGVIRFKKVESSKRPISWMELKDISGYYINSDSKILPVDANTLTHDDNRNIYPSKKLAEAALALAQLLQLRDAWNGMTQDDFVFDGTHRYFSICNRHEKVFCQEIENMRKPLSFKDEETRDAFLKQFRPIIETALPLL